VTSPPALTATGIGKRYRRRVVLHEARLAVRPGEVVAVVGENGSGKTTLLRICAGVLRPDSGQVVRTGRIGYCPQEPALLDRLTVRDHLVLFGRAVGWDGTRSLADGGRILAAFGMTGQDRTPVRHLSGGRRQKLNLALALLGGPDVLLLDEPYQGFDHGTYVNFWESVAAWRDQRKAVVVVTHLLAELWRADQVVEVPG